MLLEITDIVMHNLLKKGQDDAVPSLHLQVWVLCEQFCTKGCLASTFIPHPYDHLMNNDHALNIHSSW